MGRYRVVWLNGENELTPKSIEGALNKHADEGYRLVQTFVTVDNDAARLYRHRLYLVFEQHEDLELDMPWMHKAVEIRTDASDDILLREMREAERRVEPVADPLLDGLRR